jgi:hypothetical protein
MCRYLRSETEHISRAENKFYWKDGTPTTIQYWCILTMNTIGPDGGMVSEDDCVNKRTCFEEKSGD